jgi:hypothetical protein
VCVCELMGRQNKNKKMNKRTRNFLLLLLTCASLSSFLVLGRGRG